MSIMSKYLDLDPGEQTFFLFCLKCDYFLIHQFKHMFWLLKRTISLRQTFLSTHNICLVEKKEKPDSRVTDARKSQLINSGTIFKKLIRNYKKI